MYHIVNQNCANAANAIVAPKLILNGLCCDTAFCKLTPLTSLCNRSTGITLYPFAAAHYTHGNISAKKPQPHKTSKKRKPRTYLNKNNPHTQKHNQNPRKRPQSHPHNQPKDTPQTHLSHIRRRQPPALRSPLFEEHGVVAVNGPA